MNNIPTFVVIPTKWRSSLLANLLNVLERDPDVSTVHLLSNGDGGIIKPPRKTRIHDCTDIYSISSLWNLGLTLSWADADFDPYNIAYLNDDIILPENAISKMVEVLRSDKQLGAVYPDSNGSGISYTTTTNGAGGMTGFCFVTKGELDIRVDENFKLYWGDDDFVKQVISRGLRVAGVGGIPVQHQGSVTIKTIDNHEWLRLAQSDQAYFKQKYGEHRELPGK